MKSFNIFILLLLFSVVSIFLAKTALSLLNPAAVYCNSLGYKYVTREEEEGARGFCVLPDGREVDAWEFLQGKVAREFSFCERNNYTIKTVKDPEKCLRFLTDECSVCILPNGTEVEVTELMGLSFKETVCGDGVCGIPENYRTCPEDCPSGSPDLYCDSIKDGICDPDCEREEDVDCICNSDGSCEPDLGENYENCPTDCPSGSKDGLCDGIKDGICDPDCVELKEKDPDCQRGFTSLFYIIILIIVALTVFTLLRIRVEKSEG